MSDLKTKCEPIPSVIAVTDIRHNREQMAAMLHLSWKLPEELKPCYPEIKTSNN